MNKYRVVIKVGYREAWFDFDKAEKACKFAVSAIEHLVSNPDNDDKKEAINLQIVDADKKCEESEDE